jgi:DNA-binding MarR family transcriptional regulator
MSSMASEPFSAEPSSDEIAADMRALVERVAKLEATAAREGAAVSLGFSDDKMAAIASSIYRSRQMRASYFKPSLFSDPAWDMLLDLFINKIGGRRVSTTSLCLAANIPQATGLRWIEHLQEEGLIDRSVAHDDARLKVVEITPKGFQQMRRFIADSVTRFSMPMPD